MILRYFAGLEYWILGRLRIISLAFFCITSHFLPASSIHACVIINTPTPDFIALFILFFACLLFNSFPPKPINREDVLSLHLPYVATSQFLSYFIRRHKTIIKLCQCIRFFTVPDSMILDILFHFKNRFMRD